MIKEATIDVLQLQGIVKERNEYKRLLDECLKAFDTIPNSRIHGDLNTYKLASTIEAAYRRFK